ncbi:NADH-quinone oxidoreductase subunit H [Ktedonosporobacter rubrisoli]|uniref:NADH-quinone oxidoreductase subunit H n=1 Tax=Ktedonosporobacter rubrisoli TaxID=2509675 RepID=A0A4P6K1E4_KTERU|nr:NADH-quinone oxidoreductase subunit H [Ktedonosporobacter rubrisoli]QBD81642.1 NADH-quinone oxidoreductase subunit H [Ktedonosporobacter rubrisoli]
MLIQLIITILFAFLFPITSAAVINYLERKLLAWIADRVGPLHTGPHGSLQLIADIIKMVLKEDVHTSQIDKYVFLLAPSAFIAPVIAAFAVLPFSPFISLPGTALATGIIYLIAMSSLDIVGVMMAGWGSNNKYALIGGLRSAAQMISYELPLVLSLIGVVMLTSVLAPHDSGLGTISIKDIVLLQNATSWPGQGIAFFDFIFQGNTPWNWFILVQPLMLVVYYICGLAETNRVPFDIPTAESELVAGFLTEYSGLRWAMFFLGEYGNMVIVAAVVTSLFLGGWSGPGVAYLTAAHMSLGWQILGNILALAYFILKVYLLIGLFLWVQGTLPRLRGDQLMQYAWLILMPLALTNILITGMLYLLIHGLGLSNQIFLFVLGIVNWLMLFVFAWLIRRATALTTQRAQAPALHHARRRLNQAISSERQLEKAGQR